MLKLKEKNSTTFNRFPEIIPKRNMVKLSKRTYTFLVGQLILNEIIVHTLKFTVHHSSATLFLGCASRPPNNFLLVFNHHHPLDTEVALEGAWRWAACSRKFLGWLEGFVEDRLEDNLKARWRRCGLAPCHRFLTRLQRLERTLRLSWLWRRLLFEPTKGNEWNHPIMFH